VVLKDKPEKATLLGGDPSPHVKEFVPTPVTTIPPGPVGLTKMPELVPAIGIASAPCVIIIIIAINANTDCLVFMEEHQFIIEIIILVSVKLLHGLFCINC
jgi:hypothetical protein